MKHFFLAMAGAVAGLVCGAFAAAVAVVIGIVLVPVLTAFAVLALPLFAVVKGVEKALEPDIGEALRRFGQETRP
jgi:hypothetical protein